MDLRRLLRNLDGASARAFVRAATEVIDAMLLEQVASEPEATPGGRDYEMAGLSRSTPTGGWISHEELRATTQKMSEAIASEKWTEGVMLAIRLLGKAG